MKYNFDEVIDRSHNLSAKYDERIKKFGTDDVIPLWIADMDFRVAAPIVDAVKKRAEEGVWGYTSRPDSYFEAVALWQKKRHNWDVDTSLMSYSLGVVSTIEACIQLFTPLNGNILIMSPVYPQFYGIPEGIGRKVIENKLINKNGSWEVDWVDFEEKLKDSDMLVFCSPQNPLGLLWTREELEKVAKLCMKYNVKLLDDEIHADLIFHNKVHIPMASISKEIASYVITAISGTKTFNLAGLQASTVVFPNMHDKILFDKYWESKDISRNNAFSIVAMETAFREGDEWLDQLLSYISGNFDFVVDYLNKYIPKIKTYAPDATYLMWLDCRELGFNQEELIDFFVHKAKLGLNDGKTFDRTLDGYMRLNVACPRCVLEKAMKQLEDAVNNLT